MKKPIDRETKLKLASIIIAILGISSLIFRQFGAEYFEQTTLVDAQPIVLNEDSASNVNETYATVFTLKQGYMCNVLISNIYDYNGTEDIRVYLTFVPLGTYLQAYEDEDDPDTVASSAGLYFTEIENKYPVNMRRDAMDTITGGYVAENQVYAFEFMGAGDTNNIWSLPGQYAVIIWVVVQGGIGEVGSFGVRISVDGQGDLLRTIFAWIGGISLLVAVILAIAYLRMTRRR